MEKHIILGVHITDRVQHATEVQAVFTEFGRGIKTRLGLHRVDANACSPAGLILLELCGEEARCDEMAAKLNAIEGVEAKKMVFEHE